MDFLGVSVYRLGVFTLPVGPMREGKFPLQQPSTSRMTTTVALGDAQLHILRALNPFILPHVAHWVIHLALWVATLPHGVSGA